MMPLLCSGLVVSRGEVQIARKSGQQFCMTIPDLSAPEELDVMESISRSHYDLSGHRGGDQRILRYRSKASTILIPAMELIRFLFLLSRTLADALLRPLSLMELAVTPLPGIYSGMDVDFTARVPCKLLTPEFVREFAWLSVHPDGRRAWDSVLLRSDKERFLLLDPPPSNNCRIVFRGVELNHRYLVLEILSLSGRLLPAETIQWTHPSVCEKTDIGIKDGIKCVGTIPNESRPPREREHLVDGSADSLQLENQDVVLLGGKRGCFDTATKEVKLFRPRKASALRPANEEAGKLRKARSDAGLPVNPNLPSWSCVKLSVPGNQP